MQFVSLHTHSTFSYGDGLGMPAEHVARVAELGMKALALTDHGNVSGHVKLDQAAKAAGIKPIFGLEAYTGPKEMREIKQRAKWHQTILAADQTGYHNLMELVSRSYSEGFYHDPTIHWDMLVDHNAGLIVTSGCADSLLSSTLLGGQKAIEVGSERAAIGILKAYQRLFGDRFYLEVQAFPTLERTRLINAAFQEWSVRFGVGLVATRDVHHPLPEQTELRKILHAANRGIASVDVAAAQWEYDVPCTYPATDHDLFDALRATGLSTIGAMQAIKNSAEIADRCNVELPSMARVQYPFAQDGAESPDDLIRQWLSEGWVLRGFDRLDPVQRRAARQRVQRELDVFEQKDFIHYFLMIADAVRFAKSEGIAVGPGRGSAAASLCMYLLQVTEINPLEFPLMMFERFVDPDRMDLPDVDIDFDPGRRDEVRQYLVRKYGENRVGNVGTYTYYRGKNSVNDVARVHNVPFVVAQKVKDMTPDEGFKVAHAVFPVVQDLVKEYPQLEWALQLEGNIKGFGIHAAGLVVGAEPLSNYVATYTRVTGTGLAKKRVSVLSVDKYDGETMGLLKIDALGLTTMGEIQTMAGIAGMSLEEVYRIPLDEDAVLQGFRDGRTNGIFQFAGSTTRDICVEVAPREFMDLAHINALSRPGPLHGGSTAQFIKARQGHVRGVMHPLIEEVLATTEGELIYQEQVIKLAQVVGGFDVAGAARVRSIMSKKKGQAAFADLWKDFAEGALKNGVPAEEAKRVWRNMITSGGYAFNVAHAVSYSVLAYWTMWFRVHHPLAFFYARLLHAADKEAEATLDILKDMTATAPDIKVMPLDPWFSGANWTIDEGALRPGFRQVKGIGASVANLLVLFRDGWAAKPWISWDDYLQVGSIGPKTIKTLTDFAESDDPFGVKKLFRQSAEIAEWAHQKGRPKVTKTSDMIPYREGKWSGVLLGVVIEVQLRDLFETHRNRTGEVLSRDDVDQPELATSAYLYCEDVRGKYKIRINRFTYPRYRREIEAIDPGKDWVLAAVSKSNFPGKTTKVDAMWVISL